MEVVYPLVYPRGVGATTSFFTVFLGAEKIQVPSSARIIIVESLENTAFSRLFHF